MIFQALGSMDLLQVLSRFLYNRLILDTVAVVQKISADLLCTLGTVQAQRQYWTLECTSSTCHFSCRSVRLGFCLTSFWMRSKHVLFHSLRGCPNKKEHPTPVAKREQRNDTIHSLIYSRVVEWQWCVSPASSWYGVVGILIAGVSDT